jgi:hypothetical protein
MESLVASPISNPKLWETIRLIREKLNEAIEPDPQIYWQVYDEAARVAIARHGGLKVEVRGNGVEYLKQFKKFLLANDCFEEVAYLQWGPQVFHTKPQSVQRIWQSIDQNTKTAIIGAGGMGKTFTIIVKLVLEYEQDPEYTTIKLISSSGGSADANCRSTLATLWKTAAIPIEGDIQSTYIGLDVNERRFGIERIAIPIGDDAKARLRGKCHPFPRRQPSEKFGTHSRVRVFLDEDETIPIGVWEEIQNVLSGSDDKGSIKVMRANNPKDKASLSGQNNEPVAGWESVTADSEGWVSKTGWNVVHIDGSKCENVVEKRVVYPGMLTYDGYMQYVRDPLPPEYWTYGRGFYPPQGVQGSIITENLLADVKGIFLWQGIPKNLCAVDTALEGGDDCVATFGKYGFAHKFIPIGGGLELMLPRPIPVLLVETQITLPKGDTVAMVARIRAQCEAFNVEPKHLIVDRTGNGAGVHDLLKSSWNSEILGLEFGEAATERKMFDEDSKKCNEIYKGVVTELWWAVRRYLEFGYLKFAPALQTPELYTELLGRKYDYENKLLRVESKKSYKAHKRKSPDRADSLTLFVHLSRALSTTSIAMVNTAQSAQPRISRQTVGVAEAVHEIEFND